MGIPTIDIINLARILKRAAVVLFMSPWLWFSALVASVSVFSYALYEHFSDSFDSFHNFIVSLFDSSLWGLISSSSLYRTIIYATGSDVLWLVIKVFIGQLLFLFLLVFASLFGLVLFGISKKFVSWMGQFVMEI